MSSSSMRRLIAICEDAGPKFREVKPGVWRRVNDEPQRPIGSRDPVEDSVADYVWDDANEGWVVNWVRGPFTGMPLTQRIWRHVTGNHPMQHGVAPERDGVIYWIEKEDAQKAVEIIVPFFKKTGYEV